MSIWSFDITPMTMMIAHQSHITQPEPRSTNRALIPPTNLNVRATRVRGLSWEIRHRSEIHPNQPTPKNATSPTQGKAVDVRVTTHQPMRNQREPGAFKPTRPRGYRANDRHDLRPASPLRQSKKRAVSLLRWVGSQPPTRRVTRHVDENSGDPTAKVKATRRQKRTVRWS